MDDPASICTYLSLGVLLCLSFLFSGSETALLRIDEIALRQLRPDRDPRAKRVLALRNAMPTVIAALLLGNTAVNIGFATVTTTLLMRFLPASRTEALSTVVSTVLILFFGEIMPKTLVTLNPIKPALALSSAVSLLSGVLRPVTAILDGVAEVALKALGWKHNGNGSFQVTPETIEVAADLGREQGALEEAEHQMIVGALDTGETTVREIMTPRPDVVRLPSTSTVHEAVEAIVRTGYSRIPVFGGQIDNVVGTVEISDLLPLVLDKRCDVSVSDVLRPAHFVPETTTVAEFMADARERGIHMAIVLDEFGGTAGIVTMEDAIEEIVGDIDDEFDPLVFEAQQVDGGFLLSARLFLDDVNERFGIDLPSEDDVDTVGGLVYSLSGEVPRLGDTVRAGDWQLTVFEMKGSRIMKVRARPVLVPSLAEEVGRN